MKISPEERRAAKQRRELFERDCSYCGKPVEPAWNGILSHWEIGHCPCRDEDDRCKRNAEEARKRHQRYDGWLKTIGLTGKLARYQFENYTFDQRNQCDINAVNAVKQYTEQCVGIANGTADLSQLKLNLILTSETRGNGKTMLAASVIQRCLELAGLAMDTSERYAENYDESLELEQLRVTAQRMANWRWVRAVDLTRIAIQDKELFAKICICQGLVIDDVGQEFVKYADANESSWMHQIYYQIIDSRYLNELPTIITTNIPFPGSGFTRHMGTSAASRLIDNGYMLKLNGPDHRRGGLTAIGFNQ